MGVVPIQRSVLGRQNKLQGTTAGGRSLHVTHQRRGYMYNVGTPDCRYCDNPLCRHLHQIIDNGRAAVHSKIFVLLQQVGQR